ncbi:Small GTPase superfamily [Carpediemonas membranifera]|uniref:Small GTPase superfamily n=1 Tax=Carpediemonas membranifera TaxID=201153 RepID=A0A8J6C196_9EUKA|nr:Small GTPase superfamily [Carpediemonas membranifera]KAG9397341.1 Small GTPase superfamily [Carpediemonas membranifera]|eukprot:KAG9397338.1 Small GTPase superfamily [Carpediemonas membranifera]
MSYDDGRYHYSFKIALLGPNGVGKTDVLTHHLQTENSSAPATIHHIECGISYVVKDVSALGRLYRVQYWDVQSAEHYMTQVARVCRGAAGYVFVFDITDRKSFEITKRLAQLFEHTGPVVKKVLIGNKCDLESQREVSKAEAEDLVSQYKSSGMVQYFETSGVSGQGVYEAFTLLHTEIFGTIPKHPDPELLLQRGVRLGKRWYGAGGEEFEAHNFKVDDTTKKVDWM